MGREGSYIGGAVDSGDVTLRSDTAIMLMIRGLAMRGHGTHCVGLLKCANFSHAWTALLGLDLLYEVFRPHSHTHTLSRTPLDE